MKYTVYLTTTATTSLHVEAESEDEARNKAYDADTPSICAICAGWNRGYSLDLDYEWTVSDVMEDDS